MLLSKTGNVLLNSRLSLTNGPIDMDKFKFNLDQNNNLKVAPKTDIVSRNSQLNKPKIYAETALITSLINRQLTTDNVDARQPHLESSTSRYHELVVDSESCDRRIRVTSPS